MYIQIQTLIPIPIHIPIPIYLCIYIHVHHIKTYVYMYVYLCIYLYTYTNFRKPALSGFFYVRDEGGVTVLGATLAPSSWGPSLSVHVHGTRSLGEVHFLFGGAAS